ncbi:hypothetical protein HY085_03265 [Candidatus Gottesmanbacteria bacterium]|nr:hypothetical protein [Candidatus Gottesmanbacteria bacterium]
MSNFSYHRDARGNYFPVVDFLVYYKNKFQKTAALVDSGATVSIVRGR